jgi:type VI secretion system secreted protein VgrG
MGAGTREINGLVTSARFVQHENRRGIYEITLRPWLMLATRASDYRIFQNKTPLEIIEEVLADYNFPTEKRVTHRYPQRVFQVQYGETDFEFITRLMQEFGIYYFFEHKEGAHRLVLVDDLGAHKNSRARPITPSLLPTGPQDRRGILQTISAASRTSNRASG